MPNQNAEDSKLISELKVAAKLLYERGFNQSPVAVEAAITRLTALTQQPVEEQWVKLSEREPTKEDADREPASLQRNLVQAYCPDGHMSFRAFDQLRDATHWRKLPAPPAPEQRSMSVEERQKAEDDAAWREFFNSQNMPEGNIFEVHAGFIAGRQSQRSGGTAS